MVADRSLCRAAALGQEMPSGQALIGRDRIPLKHFCKCHCVKSYGEPMIS